MRKLFAIATMLVFVFAVTNVYACGEKKSSAKASKASNEKVESSGIAKTMTADSRTEKSEVMLVDYSKTGKSACCPLKSEAARAGVMKADAESVDGKAVYPVTKGCPVPCEKDTKVENMKAEKSDAKGDESQAYVSEVTSLSE